MSSLFSVKLNQPGPAVKVRGVRESLSAMAREKGRTQSELCANCV